MQIFPSSRAEGAGGEHLARSAHAERVRAARWLGRFIPASCACAALMAASITPRALPAQRAVRPAATRAAATPSLDVALSARLLRMADGRTLDTALTDSALAAGSRWIRAQATLAIGQVHGLARAAALRVLLSDKDTTVAANAAYALGLMSDTASIEALAQALRASPNVATEAAWSLGELGAPAREVIERALEAPPKATSPRAALLRAAGRLRPVPVALIAPALALPDAELRAAATYAISRNRAKDGVRALFPLVRDPDPLVRALIANAFAKALTGDSLGPAARDALHRFMGDRDHLVRTNAVRALATHGEDQAGPVLGAFGDPDVNVRVAAAQSVRSVLRTESAEWDRLWVDDTTFMVRRELLAAAARIARVMPAAAGWATDSAWRRRAAFVAAEGARAPLAQRPGALEPFLKDADARVRAASVQLLAGMVDSAGVGPLPRERVATFLTDRDPFVRAAALDGLRGAARASEVTAIAQVYRESFEDEPMDARLAAARYLAAAWARDSVSFGPAERAALAALPVSGEPLERAELAAVSLLAKWKGGSYPVKSLAFYDSVVRELVLPGVAGKRPRARIVTERGALVVELYALDAPLTVRNFVILARRGFYTDTRFHRVVPNFVAQDGDPRGDGNGGPGYAIRDELNRRRYRRGSVGMALSGPDTGGSQYFVCHAPQPHLDGHYTVFGQLVGSDAVLDAIVQGDRILRVEMIK